MLTHQARHSVLTAGYALVLEFSDRIQNSATALGVDANGWFIHEQDAGGVDQAADNGAGKAAEAAYDRRRKRLDADKAHHRVDQ